MPKSSAVTASPIKTKEKPLSATIKKTFETKDMGRHILGFLSLNDLEYMSSSEFEEMPILNTLAQDQRLWKKQLERHFPERFKTLQHHERLDYQKIHAKWVKEENRKSPGFKLLLFIREIVPGDFAKHSNEQIAKTLVEHGLNADFFMRAWDNKLLDAFTASKNQRVLDCIYSLAYKHFSVTNKSTGIEALNTTPESGGWGKILSWAVVCNQSEAIIQSLIDLKVDINPEAFALALKYGYRELCNNTILKKSYETTTVDIFHRPYKPAMNMLCTYGHSVILADFIEKYPLNIYQQERSELHTPFHSAAKHGQLECLKLLINAHKTQLAEGLNPTVSNPLLQKDGNNNTLIHLAASGGFKEIIDELIREQAQDPIDINALNNENHTALHLAIKTKNQQFIQYFLGLFGLDKTRGIATTLELLAQSDENFEIFSEFYKHSKLGLTREINSRLMLTAALWNSNKIFNTVLKNRPIDINHIGILRPDRYSHIGYTALHYAVMHDNEAMVRDLLAVPEIKVNHFTARTAPPLLLAIRYARPAISNLLMDHSLTQLTTEGRNKLFNHTFVVEEKSTDFFKEVMKANNLPIFQKILAFFLPVDATAAQKKSFFQTSGTSLLADAAFYGSEKIVEWLLDNHAEVDGRDRSNRTPLFAAVAGNFVVDRYPRNGLEAARFIKSSLHDLSPSRMAIISELHARGAAFDLTLEDGSNILHQAVQYKCLKTLEFLLELDPTLSLLSTRTDGYSALSLAITNYRAIADAATQNDRDSVSLWFDSEAFRFTSWMDAISTKYIANVLLKKLTKTELRNPAVQLHLLNAATRNSLWLVKHMHLKLRFNLQLTAGNGDSLLHTAVTSDHNDFKRNVVEYLLENKCDVNKKNHKGETPLYQVTSISKSFFAMKTLLKANASDAVANDNSTLLHAAVKMNNSFMGFLKLIEKNFTVDVNAEDQQKRTPLFFVRNKIMAQKLIAMGAEVNRVDANQQTPMIVAANNGHWDVVRLLVENQASLSAEVLYCAAKAGNTEMVTFLLTPLFETKGKKHKKIYDGIDPNLLHDGWSALHIASTNNQLGVISALLANGANINLPGPKNATALYLACQYGNIEAVRLLLERADINIDISYEKKVLPIQIALKLGHMEIYHLLMKKKLDQIALLGPIVESSSSSSSAVTGFSFFNIHANGEAKEEKQVAASTVKKPKIHNSLQTQSAASFFTVLEETDVEMVSEPKQLPAKRRNSEAETEQAAQPKKAKSETSETEQRRQREREIGGGDRSWLLDPSL